jgi:RNA-directed DNA polymerase
VAETTADLNSYGFRKNRATADAIEQCFIVLGSKNRAQWILEADIFGCFDNISHEWMLSHIPMDQNILRKWLKAGYLNKNVYYPTNDGTPQGGIISPVLANLVLDGLENKLRTRKGEQGLVNLVRYADDFVSVTRGRTS